MSYTVHLSKLKEVTIRYYPQSGTASCQEEFQDDFETAWHCSLEKMIQSSLRDFCGPDCLPGIPLRSMPGYFHAVPSAL